MAVVEQIEEVLSGTDVVEGLENPETSLRLREMFARLAEPEFEVHMIPTEKSGAPSLEMNGPAGFRRLWKDWTEAFSTFTIEIEERIDAGDRVVSLVLQRGRTRVGDVEIEAESAAVWTIREGRLAAVEFHLDPDAAMRSAGIE